MKRERLFYLDLVRALAVILILLIHYNAIFLHLDPKQLDKVVIAHRICNLYMGNLGVSLFFIISGAALMYVYGEKINIINFYKKRFMALYPMFWMAYVGAVIMRMLFNGGTDIFSHEIPKVNFIYTILGFDSYVVAIKPTFYIVGEWFLGCIIIIYILFPLLRWGVNKHPMATIGILTLLYLLSIFCYKTPLPKEEVVCKRLPEFVFGMIFVKYFKRVNWKAAMAALLVLIANTVFKPNFDSCIQTTYVGIAAFLVLVFISSCLKCFVIEKVIRIISKYSYAVFLIHHVIFFRVTGYFDLYSITTKQSYLIFGGCVIIIVIVSFLLFKTNDLLINRIKSLQIGGKRNVRNISGGTGV